MAPSGGLYFNSASQEFLGMWAFGATYREGRRALIMEGQCVCASFQVTMRGAAEAEAEEPRSGWGRASAGHLGWLPAEGLRVHFCG